jgi:hypothetical protein
VRGCRETTRTAQEASFSSESDSFGGRSLFLGEGIVLAEKITTLPERSLLLGKALSFAEKRPAWPRRSFVLSESTRSAARIEVSQQGFRLLGKAHCSA